jgi:hypothetical protein
MKLIRRLIAWIDPRSWTAGAVILALKVQSVQALWFFTSDLVFVLLFPQLLWALYDSKGQPDSAR